MTGADWSASFDAFTARVRARLERGSQTFGDRNLEAPLPALLAEVEAELEDVSAWSVLLWRRVHRLRGVLAMLEEQRQVQQQRPEREAP